MTGLVICAPSGFGAAGGTAATAGALDSAYDV